MGRSDDTDLTDGCVPRTSRSHWVAEGRALQDDVVHSVDSKCKEESVGLLYYRGLDTTTRPTKAQFAAGHPRLSIRSTTVQ